MSSDSLSRIRIDALSERITILEQRLQTVVNSLMKPPAEKGVDPVNKPEDCKFINVQLDDMAWQQLCYAQRAATMVLNKKQTLSQTISWLVEGSQDFKTQREGK